MKKYLIRKSEVQKGLLFLFLVPDTNEDRLSFLPGQYVSFGFISPNGKPSPMRSFSIVSKPSDNGLEFGIKIQGDFTKTLAQLPLGSAISVLGPFGEFVIDKYSEKNIICLAGGIGITPFVSMIRTAAEQKYPTRITLLYGIRSQDDIPYGAELISLKQRNPLFNVGFFISDGPIDKLEGLPAFQGRINEKWLNKVTGGGLQDSLFYICGPKPLTVGLTEILANNGVQDEMIICESFSQVSKVQIANNLSAQSLVFKTAVWSMILSFIIVAAIDIKQVSAKINSTNQAQYQSQDQSSVTNSNDGQSSSSSGQSTTPSTSSSNSNNNNFDTSPSYNNSMPSSSTNNYSMPRTRMS